MEIQGRDVYPIGTTEGSHFTSTLGTAFVAAPDVVVTAWHCVREAVEQRAQICLLGMSESGGYGARPVYKKRGWIAVVRVSLMRSAG